MILKLHSSDVKKKMIIVKQIYQKVLRLFLNLNSSLSDIFSKSFCAFTINRKCTKFVGSPGFIMENRKAHLKAVVFREKIK